MKFFYFVFISFATRKLYVNPHPQTDETLSC